MRKYLYTKLVLIFLCSSYLTTAQKVIESTIIGNNTIVPNSPIPFDQSFILKIPNTINLNKITYSIKIKNKKNWHYMSVTESDTIYNIRSDQSINLLLGPLHPNEDYKFSLATYTIPKIENIDAFKLEAFNIFNKHTENQEDIATVEIPLKNDLAQLINKFSANKNLFIENGQLYEPQPFDEDFKQFLNNVLSNNRVITTKQKQLDSYFKAINEILQSTEFDTISNKLFNITLYADSFDAYTNKLLQDPVNLGLEQFKEITLSKSTQVMRKIILNRGQSIKEIFHGKLKVIGNVITTSSIFDIESVLFIISSFEMINDKFISLKNKKSYFSASERQGIKNLTELLNPALETKYALDSLYYKREYLRKAAPDIFLNKFERQDIRSMIFPEINLKSKQSPYIGLDLGLGYVPELKSIISYQGINFYFTPVDQDVNFSNYQNSDRFFKRFSMFLGITQFLDSEQKRSEKRIRSNYLSIGNPVIGAGYRINNFLRFNIGNIFYKRDDPNPTITARKSDNSTLVALLSIDMAFKDLLGSLKNFF